MNSVNLDMIHDEVKARLEADDYFVDIPVLKYNEKDLTSEIEKNLAAMVPKGGKVGLFVYLAGWFADAGSRDMPGPVFDQLGLNATVVELPDFNSSATGTGKPAIQVAVRLCQVLHHYRPSGLCDTIVVDRATIRQTQAPSDSALAFVVPILVPPNIDAPARVATPELSPDDGAGPATVTVSCATSGAAIYYTLDDTHPWSGNASAHLYAGAFVAPAGCAVRAIAYKSGMIASDSALGIFS